jgi:hypothetical protein
MSIPVATFKRFKMNSSSLFEQPIRWGRMTGEEGFTYARTFNFQPTRSESCRLSLGSFSVEQVAGFPPSFELMMRRSTAQTDVE